MAPTTWVAQTIVDSFVRALGEGRLGDAQDLLHDDFVITEPGGLPFSGQYLGVQGFVELMGKINTHFELMLAPPIQYVSAGPTVAMRAQMTFTSRTSGRSIAVGLVEFYEVRDGLIVELDVYYKDPTSVAALLG